MRWRLGNIFQNKRHPTTRIGPISKLKLFRSFSFDELFLHPNRFFLHRNKKISYRNYPYMTTGWQLHLVVIWKKLTIGLTGHPVFIFVQMTTGWRCHPVVNFFQMTTGWKCHPVVIQGHLQYENFLLGYRKNLLGCRKNLSFPFPVVGFQFSFFIYFILNKFEIIIFSVIKNFNWYFYNLKKYIKFRNMKN